MLELRLGRVRSPYLHLGRDYSGLARSGPNLMVLPCNSITELPEGIGECRNVCPGWCCEAVFEGCEFAKVCAGVNICVLS